MSIVRGLVLAHLSVTALLLVAFCLLVLWQRLTGAGRTAPGTPSVAYPSEAERSAAPAGPRVVRVLQSAAVASAGASVRKWTIDLRAGAPAELQRTS